MTKWARQQPFPEGIFIEFSKKTGDAVTSPEISKEEDKSSVLDDSTLVTSRFFIFQPDEVSLALKLKYSSGTESEEALPNSPELAEPVSSTPVPTVEPTGPLMMPNSMAVKLAGMEAALKEMRNKMDDQAVQIVKLESQVDNILGQSVPDLIKMISTNELVSYSSPLGVVRSKKANNEF